MSRPRCARRARAIAQTYSGAANQATEAWVGRASSRLRLGRADSEGTLREHHRGRARPRQVTCLREIPSSCAAFVPAASRACPGFPPPRSMVRRGRRFESVRGLQRSCKSAGCVAELGTLDPSSSRGRHGVLAGPRGAHTWQADIAHRVLKWGSTRSAGAVAGGLSKGAHTKVAGGDCE
jgi:hypothetical protein